MSEQHKHSSWMVALGALGVVFGDIGTSPLYALKECFSGSHGVPVSLANVLGILSLIIWSLIIVVSLKYVSYVLRADNEGEGGVLALMALIAAKTELIGRRRHAVIVIGLFGAALLYGDSIITPAISVLSAVEGLRVRAPGLGRLILPSTIGILCGLFFLQSRGTGRIGLIFGPVMLLWFLALGIMGLLGMLHNPIVLYAVGPHHAIRFFVENKQHAFFVLGAVFLAITGAEALYADLGHFGKKPISRAWFFLVMPALILNYFGQGAVLLNDPGAADSPFYRLVPDELLWAVIVLATAATIIASQAVISGAFSLTFQAIQLGYLPRMKVEHTSAEAIGQIYVPTVNWILFILTVTVTIGFGSSSALAAAYGMAVATTMLVTTFLIHVVARRIWSWRLTLLFPLTIFILVVDTAFFLSNSMKIVEGGWLPVLAAGAVLLLMTTWHTGRKLLGLRLTELLVPFETFIAEIPAQVNVRVPGTGVYMARSLRNPPMALFYSVRYSKSLHERVVLLKVSVEARPHIEENECLEVFPIVDGIYAVILHYGFMDAYDIPEAMRKLVERGVIPDLKRVTYFIGRESVVATPRPGMAIWREKLFAFLSRNAQNATSFFRLPPEQVVEIGLQVDI